MCVCVQCLYVCVYAMSGLYVCVYNEWSNVYMCIIYTCNFTRHLFIAGETNDNAVSEVYKLRLLFFQVIHPIPVLLILTQAHAATHTLYSLDLSFCPRWKGLFRTKRRTWFV